MTTRINLLDWRAERRGWFGAFVVVNEDNEDYQRIIREGDRAAQARAYAQPEFYDDDGETEDLFHWFEAEVLRRGHTEVVQKRTRSRKKNDGAPVASEETGT